METATNSSRHRQQGTFCRLCGRPSWGAFLGECAACTSLFEIKKGRHLYCPVTGRHWLKSVGNATLVNVNHANDCTFDVPSVESSNRASRESWWGLLALGGAILFMTLRFIFRVK